jgi:hypothetical protein
MGQKELGQTTFPYFKWILDYYWVIIKCITIFSTDNIISSYFTFWASIKSQAKCIKFQRIYWRSLFTVIASLDIKAENTNLHFSHSLNRVYSLQATKDSFFKYHWQRRSLKRHQPIQCSFLYDIYIIIIMIVLVKACCLYYKHIMIVSDDSRFVSKRCSKL